MRGSDSGSNGPNGWLSFLADVPPDTNGVLYFTFVSSRPAVLSVWLAYQINGYVGIYSDDGYFISAEAHANMDSVLAIHNGYQLSPTDQHRDFDISGSNVYEVLHLNNYVNVLETFIDIRADVPFTIYFASNLSLYGQSDSAQAVGDFWSGAGWGINVTDLVLALS